MTHAPAASERPRRRTRRVVVADLSAIARRVGARIREARLQAGLSQRQLAAGRYTGAYISALESGKAKPSVASLAFIAEKLGLEPSELLSSAPAPAAENPVIPRRVWFADARVYFELDSGLQVGVPAGWIPSLQHATLADLNSWEVDTETKAVRWERANAEVSVNRLLARAGLVRLK